MRTNVKKVAVLGAGTMGSQIAALVANSDTKVVLLDIVPEGAEDRTKLAKEAVKKLKKGKSLSSKDKADNIEPANMEDDLDKLKDVDWIVECVPEDEDIKHETYQKIAPYLKQGAVVSSNTSTIPLRELKEGLEESLKSKLCITHFFNPPTKMALLEVVADQDNDAQTLKKIEDFADHALGKHIVEAEDTPGFIANRIGMFWMICGMQEAQRQGISIEMADKVMNGAFGFPKTGIFGLMDLIGLKLIPDIAESMNQYLRNDDDFKRMYDGAPIIQERIKLGYTGKKEGGFYRKENSKKQALNLKSGEYRDRQEPEIEIGEDWQAFLEKDAPESRFAREVLVRTLAYTAKVAPDIADDIREIDAAMREGYNWEKGPFEMMDRLGADWLIEQLEERSEDMPELLRKAKGKGFYREQEGRGKDYLTFTGEFRRIEPEEGKWSLEIFTAAQKPGLENNSARLWDIEDGIACLEFTKGKLRVMDEAVLELLDQSIDKVQQEFSGLVIGHDGKHFSAGLDLKLLLGIAEDQDWQRLEKLLQSGQETLLRLKTAPFPKVLALSGYALGGGCELTLHCDAAQVFTDTRIGLVETGIGVIPAWGGTKEMLFRAVKAGGGDINKASDALAKAFRIIAEAKKSDHAEAAFDLGYLNDRSRISRNRERLLPEAKALCLELANNYTPSEHFGMNVPVTALRERLNQELETLKEQEEDFSSHREQVLARLADALSGYAAAQAKGEEQAGRVRLTEEDVLASTRKRFIELVKTKETQEMIRRKV